MRKFKSCYDLVQEMEKVKRRIDEALDKAMVSDNVYEKRLWHKEVDRLENRLFKIKRILEDTYI
ncbi:MAG: hypothetical protein HUJ68_04940 [Clostridia bacterium]|nr:hypothetical protein [Clostridia bacterium]